MFELNCAKNVYVKLCFSFYFRCKFPWYTAYRWTQ